MQELIDLVSNLSKSEGRSSTYLPQVKTYRASIHSPRGPLLYNQGIIFVVQGEKNVYMENSSFTYDPDNYLVLTVPLPLECEGSIKNDKPLLGIVIDLEIPLLNEIISLKENLTNYKKPCNKGLGIYTNSADKNFKDIILRLAKALQSSEQSTILGPNILRELTYNILNSENACPLYELAMKNTHLSKIEVALKEIHTNYDKAFDVDSLAKLVNMSVSSFHQSFKDVTSSSPIQYIKKIRLNKARDKMITDSLRVNEVARQVGYESISQFNREFKRYFGVTPGSYITN